MYFINPQVRRYFHKCFCPKSGVLLPLHCYFNFYMPAANISQGSLARGRLENPWSSKLGGCPTLEAWFLGEKGAGKAISRRGRGMSCPNLFQVQASHWGAGLNSERAFVIELEVEAQWIVLRAGEHSPGCGSSIPIGLRVEARLCLLGGAGGVGFWQVARIHRHRHIRTHCSQLWGSRMEWWWCDVFRACPGFQAFRRLASQDRFRGASKEWCLWLSFGTSAEVTASRRSEVVVTEELCSLGARALLELHGWWVRMPLTSVPQRWRAGVCLDLRLRGAAISAGSLEGAPWPALLALAHQALFADT